MGENGYIDLADLLACGLLKDCPNQGSPGIGTTHISAHTHTCTHIQTHMRCIQRDINMCVQTHAYVYSVETRVLYIDICKHLYINTHVCLCKDIHAYKQRDICTYKDTHTYRDRHTDMHTDIYLYRQTYIYAGAGVIFYIGISSTSIVRTPSLWFLPWVQTTYFISNMIPFLN